ncbi:helix-turn-helix domain-containing protein [Pantoea sp. ACRSH]|uniref:helix-turn-helix domain-containing protein n=1 Tax=unclassified Pantoea TaxID=2630326 RepID=UPI001EF4251C|nr:MULTISPECIES: helix-turn-helix domain-containing protein [unclassified Pantoea]MCG7367368.1 helix-turn-helix domain-containing protein [Pantoea sp. ACRSH]MCG7397661.1 helix-turn-helix domain-containing protein [Pantoea sp. ACRSC]
MESYALSMDEACAFLGISRPTCNKWIKTGRLAATRKDPSKPKSPYLLTRQACIAALNNPMHTVAVSAADAHEEKSPCRSFAEVKFGTPVSQRRAEKELSSLLARPTGSKRRSSTTS